jgi:hypothetical protein
MSSMPATLRAWRSGERRGRCAPAVLVALLAWLGVPADEPAGEEIAAAAPAAAHVSVLTQQARRVKRCKSLRGKDFAPARKVRLVRRRNGDDGTDPPCGSGDSTATAAFVNGKGQAAAAIVPAFSGTTFIAAFTARGVRHDLDSGPSAELPASALRLVDGTVQWTHSGTARSAPLPQ